MIFGHGSTGWSARTESEDRVNLLSSPRVRTTLKNALVQSPPVRTVSVGRFIRARPAEIETHLSPETIIAYEGTFSIADIETDGDSTVISAEARGIDASFRFEPLDRGYRYSQEGTEGPFESMETTITYRPKDEGSEVTMESAVALGLRPRRLFDRVAAWKRKGELKRALKALADGVE